MFKRAIEETYGDTSPTVTKKAKYVAFVKSDEVVDLTDVVGPSTREDKSEEKLRVETDELEKTPSEQGMPIE